MTYDTLIAANTSRGFFCYFDELINDAQNKNVCLIKGGPGCGKSTFMKKIAKSFEKEDDTVEKIHCSSDPNSLDALRIDSIKTVVMDATSPHAYDLKYAGVRDRILDFTRFWDQSKLKQNKNEILKLFDDISMQYRSVYSVLKSCGILYSYTAEKATHNCNREQITQTVKKIIKQFGIMPTQNNGKIQNRFINSISCDGTGGFFDTFNSMCDEIVIIYDGYFLSGLFMTKLFAYIKKCGYDVIAFHNPLCPEQFVDHIIIPQLRFGICTSSSIFAAQVDDAKIVKKINTRNYIDKDYVNQNKNKILFKKKIISEIIDKSTADLKHIKSLHDELEEHYKKAMDFDALNEFNTKFIQEII